MNNNNEENVMALLEYLADMVESGSKLPITGKVMVDKKEMLATIDETMNRLPADIKKAEWVVNEKERILAEARKENESVRQETIEIMRKRVENHNVVKEAEIKAQEIIALAQRQAKTIMMGSKEYADEILSQLEREIESKNNEFLNYMKKNMEQFAMQLTDDLNKTALDIRENIKELRS